MTSPSIRKHTGNAPVVVPSRLDIIQAITGVLLILFLWAHVFLVSSVIISPALMNGIADFFERTYMAQIGGPLVLLLIVYHFLIAARKMPFRASEFMTFWRNARSLRHKDTWLWVVQVVTAIVILVMASIHIYVVLSTLPITAEQSASRVQGGWLPFFLILLPMAELHLGIGFYRLGVKYGYITRASRHVWQRNEYVLTGIFILIGLLTLVRFMLLTN